MASPFSRRDRPQHERSPLFQTVSGFSRPSQTATERLEASLAPIQEKVPGDRSRPAHCILRRDRDPPQPDGDQTVLNHIRSDNGSEFTVRANPIVLVEAHPGRGVPASFSDPSGARHGGHYYRQIGNRSGTPVDRSVQLSIANGDAGKQEARFRIGPASVLGTVQSTLEATGSRLRSGPKL